MHKRYVSEDKCWRRTGLCLWCRVEIRLKYVIERTKDIHISISWFCFSVRLELGIHTAVTFYSDQLQHLVSTIVVKVYTTCYGAALYTLHRSTGQRVPRNCLQELFPPRYHQAIVSDAANTYKPDNVYLKYLQSDLFFIWANYPPL